MRCNGSGKLKVIGVFVFEFKSEALSVEIKKFVTDFHYLHSCPLLPKYVFTIYDGSKLVGVALISNFSRFQAKSRYKNCLELSRLVVADECPKNTESFFLGNLLRWMKENTVIKGIVSYADPTVGHQGTIYKAANFRLIGKSTKSYHYVDLNGKWINKKTVWDQAKDAGQKEIDFAELKKLTKVTEEKKFIYFYELINGYLDKLMENDFDLDDVMAKKVSYHKIAKKWMAYVKTKNHKKYIGYFNSEEDAWNACDEFEREFKGKKYKSSYLAEEIKNHSDLPDNFDKHEHAIVRVGPKIYFIDRNFLDFVIKTKWNTYSTYMTMANTFEKSQKAFHRRVMNAPDGLIVDHINGMKNDNRRVNLRCVKHSVNNHNVDHRPMGEYIGVRFNRDKYEANITFQYRQNYLGRFLTKEEAARAYDMKAIEFYGKDAKTNFPITDYDITGSALIDDVKEKTFIKSPAKQCLCGKEFKSSNFDLCYRCMIKQNRREIAAFEGREVKQYKERVKETLETCQIEGCSKAVMSRNLCAAHYYHDRRKEDPGYGLNKKKKIYPCTHPGCQAQYQHRESLCLVHYNEKHGIIPGPRTGRPGKEKVDCRECGAVKTATQPSCVCQKCYRRSYMAARRSTDKDYGKKKS